MNFQELLKVERADIYLDIAFKRSKQKASTLNLRNLEPEEKLRRQVREKIISMNDSLKKNLHKIITSFPNIDELPEFYIQLIKTQLDYVMLKKSLGAIDWCVKMSGEFAKDNIKKLKGDKSKDVMNKRIKAYYGRVSSLLKRVDKHLKFLEEARKIMKRFPSVKTSVSTVVLYGFPNVGKTTLLSKLTGSKAEINNYAFTTRDINISYIKSIKKKIQVIDTPGTLARPDKMNDIERLAELVLKYCADLIVFVYDPSQEILKQEELLKKTKKRFEGIKKFSVYVTKTDLFEYNGEYIKDINELKRLINKI